MVKNKLAYVWGPISSFSGGLIASLLQRGWQVHLATKSAFNLLSLSPLELRSSAQGLIERALGGHERLKPFQDRLRFYENSEFDKATKYDALIFCGIPSNFDEPRAPRAAWSVNELTSLAKALKGVPVYALSSLWGGIQADRVVPEELEFERRKPTSHWESVCQQYEQKLVKLFSQHQDITWHLIRLPMLAGSSVDGHLLNFSGLFTLLHELAKVPAGEGQSLKLAYSPDSTLWFSPGDTAVHLFTKLLEDESKPRICNLVSTQSTLNREWLNHLAQALGYAFAEPVDSDGWSLPGILRKMLTDDVQVKTRNLFEVAGRYQHGPIRLDVAYFEKMLEFGRKENWGHPVHKRLPALHFTEDFARDYFQKFMADKIEPRLVREATKNGTSIGFYVSDADNLRWVLKSPNGGSCIQPLADDCASPRVRFHFSGETMARIIDRKLSLSKAVLSREIKVEGPIVDALRVGGVMDRFLRDHPFQARANSGEVF